MKTLFKYRITLILAIFISLVSCNDSVLDIQPRDRLTDSSVYTDKNATDLVLNDIYLKLPNGNNSYEPFENFSDNSICAFSWVISRNYARMATWTPDNVTFSWINMPLTWSEQYSNIRRCNLFIKNVQTSTLPDDFKKLRIAETKFLRAYFYHLLWMTYGGVPVITEVLNSAEMGDDIFRPRNTFDETYKFIRDELTAVSADLPTTPAQAGRVTKGAALALKGWVEMFANKYSDAAVTYKQIIDDMGGGKVYQLFPDYQQFFMPENNTNKEGIFYRQYVPRVNGGSLEGIWAATFTKGGAETAWGAAGPTQELVDDYCMANGKPITDPTSGYDPQKPYKNREPRFYQSIVYDGSYYYNDTIKTRQGIGSPNEIDFSDKNDATQTGYYLRKRMNEKIPAGADSWGGNTGGQNYYFFRYAEVLLSYAEAKNEVSGPDASVIAALDEVRTRAKIPGIQETYGNLTKDQMRVVIRRERRIELAFEEKRYWDLIRWKIAVEKLNGDLHGMLIKKVGGVWTYTPSATPGGKRTFNEKNYLFPIPTSAMVTNSKLTQNPGY